MGQEGRWARWETQSSRFVIKDGEGRERGGGVVEIGLFPIWGVFFKSVF